MKKHLALIVNIILALSLLTGCGLLGTVPTASQSQEVTLENVKIRIAALPIIDALPFYVAQKEGLFAKYGVEVEFIPAASAAERDQLITAGQADGMINDMVSVALYNRDQVQVQVVRFARYSIEGSPMYGVLAAKDSGITSPADLAGVPIGISQGTIIDYVTSRMLEKEGLSSDQIQSIAVPKLNERMALLGSGELKAATLPEPFATLAQQNGAVRIVDDTKYPEYANSVISFRKAFIDEHPQGIEQFLTAVNDASALINEKPDQYRALLGEYKLVPEAMQQTYPIPQFPTATWPTKSQFDDAVAWAKSKGMLTTDVKYEDSVTSKFLMP